MKILAIDTAAAFCAACLYDSADAIVLGRETLEIGKGHAERLMGVIAAALEQSGLTYGDLDAIAVSVGPGSFTGIRIGVAAARGLALAQDIPCAGVTTLEALAFEAQNAFPGRSVLPVLDAKREEIYAALHGADGSAVLAPMVTDAKDAAAIAREHDAVLVGSAAEVVAGVADGTLDVAGGGQTADIASFAAVAAQKGFDGAKPAPLYLRGADVRPQSGFALPRKTAS
ncbi:tRNA (adenosine(37)-N6)-threonylcarbamoyltransferase complex dimerization subunit type 1 TsaB [Mesorhizobium xinjiangense]|uniref:tRNA (adenosine(37)-N6)-threonylcarbamoyltransferase complex dimerization subunit type 1 TsaB n=1 Tax=Mesorhizobium xinjiangense TaxID=2678685 RepID=UPI0012EE29B2|nr:tRNA (adenosine(37)-N6)-threonylcarbamoyltransferase complex dimerization subunit type 1 TsaB [Mesorhizobium xinjiangense]